MKRSLVTLSLLALPLTGLVACNDQQSGGGANPDSQVEQPPLPGQTEPRDQGADPDQGPDADSSNPADDTGDNGSEQDADEDTNG